MKLCWQEGEKNRCDRLISWNDTNSFDVLLVAQKGRKKTEKAAAQQL